MIINGIYWNIYFVEPWSSKLQREDGVYTLGATIPRLRSIYINRKLPEDMMIKVVSHEVTHAYASSYNIKMPIEIEEMIADFLATYGRDILMAADDIIRDII